MYASQRRADENSANILQLVERVANNNHPKPGNFFGIGFLGADLVEK